MRGRWARLASALRAMSLAREWYGDGKGAGAGGAGAPVNAELETAAAPAASAATAATTGDRLDAATATAVPAAAPR